MPVDRIVATGGLPHAAPALIQTFADMLQQPIAIHPSTQGPAVGAAVLGGLASGEFAGIKEAVEAMAQSPSEGTVVEPDPAVYEYSDIDTSNYASLRGAEADYFTLFEFSARHDPVPTMLTQSHRAVVNGFLGQTTGFQRRVLKDHVIVLAEVEGTDEIKYLHGTVGRGTFTFYGGHDPEDYTHQVGDPPTDLDLHPSSPGYRLILNNVLFPAARKKPQKT